jgi:hypothetical protein
MINNEEDKHYSSVLTVSTTVTQILTVLPVCIRVVSKTVGGLLNVQTSKSSMKKLLITTERRTNNVHYRQICRRAQKFWGKQCLVCVYQAYTTQKLRLQPCITSEYQSVRWGTEYSVSVPAGKTTDKNNTGGAPVLDIYKLSILIIALHAVILAGRENWAKCYGWLGVGMALIIIGVFVLGM